MAGSSGTNRSPDSLFSFYPIVALDGTHIWFDADQHLRVVRTGIPFVQRQTLDGRWEVKLEVDAMGEAISEGPDYTWFYDIGPGWGGAATSRSSSLDPDGRNT